ncbi:hypothetical protein [Natronomonas pharaonis]|nr:hypothetical protein [Natronomonas pharaonis]
MASNQCSKPVRTHRRQYTDGHEPLNTEERTVQQRNTALYANLTEYATMTLNLDKGQTVRVETYRGGIWIEPVDDTGTEVDIDVE